MITTRVIYLRNRDGLVQEAFDPTFELAFPWVMIGPALSLFAGGIVWLNLGRIEISIVVGCVVYVLPVIGLAYAQFLWRRGRRRMAGIACSSCGHEWQVSPMSFNGSERVLVERAIRRVEQPLIVELIEAIYTGLTSGDGN